MRAHDRRAPRVTDVEGERKFDALPILRIVNEGDQLMTSEFWKNSSRERMLDRINDHFIAAYIARLAPKRNGAIQVPYEDRAKYVKESAG
jgi:hypothetical protein